MEDRLGRKIKDWLCLLRSCTALAALSQRGRDGQGPVTLLPCVHYLCSSPCVQQTVLQRWHHTQHKMEACRTRHRFNLPLPAPSYHPFNPQQATPKSSLSLFSRPYLCANEKKTFYWSTYWIMMLSLCFAAFSFSSGASNTAGRKQPAS